MTIDREEFDEDDEHGAGARRRFTDFDCPVCSANNPYDDAFGGGDEIRCFFCGQGFAVAVSDGGRLRLREV